MYGYLGSDVIPSWILEPAKNAFLLLFDTIIYPIIALLIPSVAAKVVSDYISKQPAWLQVLMSFGYVAEVTVTATAMEEVLLAACVAANIFISNYFGQMHSVSEVASLFTGGGHINGHVLDFDGLASDISTKRQCLVSYWNLDDKTGKMDLGQGFHTIFVKKTINGYMAYNRKENGISTTEGDMEADSIQLLLNPNGDLDLARKQFIAGYVFK